jgi:hypothetical protein
MMRKIIFGMLFLLTSLGCDEDVASLQEGSSVRMVIEETQCDNPWQMSPNADEYRSYIKSYLESEGLEADNITVLDELPEGTALCMACSCWSGNNIYISIPASQVERAEALGFERVA